MNPQISNELLNMFNRDKTSNSERIKINSLCNDLSTNTKILSEMNNILHSLVEKENFSLLENMSAVISGIIKVVDTVEYYKEITYQSGRMKYVLYCLLITIFFNTYNHILEKTELDSLRQKFEDAYSLLVLIPRSVKKTSCVSCIGDSFKLFRFVNKKKIIV